VIETLGVPGRKVHGYMSKVKAADLIDAIKEEITEEAAQAV